MFKNHSSVQRATPRLTALESRIVPTGPEFQVNTYATSSQTLPSVASDSLGNIVMAWESNGQDGDGFGIFARQFNKTGVPSGAEFQVNSKIAGNQQWARAAMDSDGDYVIA